MQALQGVWSQLEAKSVALADAEQRFLELEGLMRRMMARSAGLTGAPAAAAFPTPAAR
jgi:hypothetical protein